MPERRRRDDEDENKRPRRPAARKGRPRRTDADEGKRSGRPAARNGRPAAERRTTDRDRSRGRKRTNRDSQGRGRDKRTSRNSDDRNPTRSGIQYPSRKIRRAEAETESPRRPALRKVRTARPQEKPKRARKDTPPKAPPRRRRNRSTEAMDELARIAGRNASKAQDQLARAAEAYAAGRERDALKQLRPLRDAYPDVAAVRELLGLAHYRIGNYEAAAKELEAFLELSDSVEQHPVLMDCARAKRKFRRVDDLWRELAESSPSAALVNEGRIVLAGSLADRGRLTDAIATLERRAGEVQRVQEHHLRVWYALADLSERAGDIPRARQLFMRIRKHEAGFADVAERLSALN